MKKILSLITIAAFTALVACGPSAEEKAAAEKARQDSINQAMAAQMAADSTARAMEEMARMEAMRADSIAKAEAEAAATAAKPKAKAKPKPAAPTTAPETPKVGKKKPGAN